MTIKLHEEKPLHQAEPLNPMQLLTRVRAVIGMLDLNCVCRSKLNTALDRFENLETRRQLRTLLLDARHQAERIGVLLELVGELDAIESDETDLGVFDEISLLFQDIGAAAQVGAADMIRAKSLAAECGAGRTRRIT